MNKNINIGAVHIASFNPKEGKMFSYDFYYEEDEYKKDVKSCDPKEVVLPPNKEFVLEIDYPVSTTYKAKIKTGKKGMTRLQLTSKICEHYRKMYAEEDKTAGGDPGHIPGMFNRMQSEGKYGIWGHDIGDLVLCDAKISTKKGVNVIQLGVDS